METKQAERVREVPVGTRVIYAASEGVYRYDGRAADDRFTEIAISLGGDRVHGLKCHPSQVAPEGTPVPEKDGRVVAVKMPRGEVQSWQGPWRLSVSGVRFACHRTKRDATAEGLRRVAIADWHAAEDK